MAPKKVSKAHAKSESSNNSSSGRVLAITAVDGFTGSAVLELLMSDNSYKGKISKIIGLTFGEPKEDTKAVLDEYGVETALVDEMDEDKLKELGVDTLCLIPPARKDKAKLVKQILELGKKSKSVKNLVFLSSAGCDYAERDKQPHLREFIHLEVLAMAPKSDESTGETGHSPCIVRAGFYCENLLLYSKQAQGEGKLPLPVDPHHKFAPVSLGDVALLLAKILTSEGEHGLSDDVRGQMIPLTGPQMVAGPELAEAASQALGTKMEFQSVKESEAKKILSIEQGEEIDEAEKAYILEYYSLVREGKTNYVAGRPTFKQITGQDLTLPAAFFESYQDSFKRKKRRTTKDE
ncbi:hypothetical protein NBRC10513v2_006604 [Rhodotorula toruloides]|uniref:BY PROTMAP: gi/472584164/gb/EMS21770.1/ NAD(P)-binding protein [Rhodosporidium toruloides NP11] gi/647394512/emb/CDR35742.1/ RHTO0S01e06106g1_1 [Rhodosporidium toruloides] n=1 Tax=Rhodotorula toruloides TaxID=5286 RepID=A0A0K3CQD0_RHOTO|nr:NAD-P-binding protein [Rhodotorula toruloides]